MIKLLEDACLKLNVPLHDVQVDMFFKYMETLLEWNEKINLTSITNERDIILKHFVDSVSIVSLRSFNGKSIIDVGTGAGFPGIPIKIVCSASKVTLLDSLNKRINFLENVVNELNLDNVTCIHSRAEDGAHNTDLRERFDFCVSRAVANLAVLTEYCLPFVNIGGEFISLKGPDCKNEVEEAEKAIKILGGEISDIKQINIPYSDITHSIIFIKKVKNTPSKYPRKSGSIAKNPIK